MQITVGHRYPFHEELANTITHGLGVFCSIAGGAVLIALAAVYGDAWQIVSASIFVSALLMLYTASTLYHAIPHENTKARLKIFDHCAIFVLIAGTYTPFTLIALRGVWGWSLFGTVWGLAALGIGFKLFFTGRFRGISTAIYVAMGWLVLVAIKPMSEALTSMELSWLVWGGLFYTLGTIFYMFRRIPYGHAIWHCFVLGGSVCHYAAVMLQVIND
ncbi:PAQR family membrane homeostasis protein TrhA [Gallaecimonas pentaromativorans]|uniref:Hemolysin III n=1 Tax=Gallaecimonas pentaromativorans TaxID=584787 RepID=A0A3N1PCM7_9GAMM|nr:hemolysin III family protein [Gallaecimonas pentaromativorans]MED5525983.1 hemolysin III family protein [Pseudomonadota bacterium]ROQ29704.1 hemolysin III [Gallaecimonas pentaromativorans]